MIVYGDPQFTEIAARAIGRLRVEALRLPSASLDEWRSFLVKAGQSEQGIADFFEKSKSDSTEKRVHQLSQFLTDQAALGFFNVCRNELAEIAPAANNEANHLDELLAVLDQMADFSEEIIIKVPEGYEFYALYPEQYCLSAVKWAMDHTFSTNKRVLVVGLRSIGTSLSALVTVTLRTLGWHADRITMRPTGHPFSRKASVEAEVLSSGEWALIVDEGPGMSGSSMVSAAEALVKEGFSRSSVSFLPGHDRRPGHAASADVLQWWDEVPIYFTPSSQLRWRGLSLPEILIAETAGMLGQKEVTGISIQDVSGGLWRQFTYSREEQWPAVALQFEKTKYLATSSNGEKILWKFAGFGSYTDRQNTNRSPGRPSELGVSRTEILRLCRGFQAQSWAEGRLLEPADANAQFICQLANCLASSAGREIGEEERRWALARLKKMAGWNVSETLGKENSLEVEDLGERAIQSVSGKCPSYGDGRWAPYEWRKTFNGQLVKTGPSEVRRDHTIVGVQSIAWDVAGTIVEWDLNVENESLLRLSLERLGILIEDADLAFHILAYSALRLGQMRMSLDSISDGSPEYKRLTQAFSFYQRKIQERIAGFFSETKSDLGAPLIKSTWSTG